MAKKMIKIIKHHIIAMIRIQKCVNNWDLQLQKILFGYMCGIQASTKFFLFVIQISHMNKLEWRRWWNMSLPRWNKQLKCISLYLGMWKNHNTRKKRTSIKRRKKNVDQFCCRRIYGQDEQTKQKKISRDQLGKALPPRRHLQAFYYEA